MTNNYYHLGTDEPKECSECFTPLLSEDVECGMCGSCQYIDSANEIELKDSDNE